jgi:enoyl-CoA hydratase/carnithine racemase
MPTELRTERRGSTLVLTMSGAATRNTLSEQLFTAGIEALAVAESDAAVRCLVLQGEGDHFSVGDDLNARQEHRAADAAVQMERAAHFRHFVEALRACPKPVIAAVEGLASGGGFSLALACDLMVAAEDARFAMTHGQIGHVPDGGGSWLLAQLLPRPRALALLWLAEPVGARELQQYGLVHQVVDSGTALTQACALAERLAQAAPEGLASVKGLVDQAARHTLLQQLPTERGRLLTDPLHANAGEGLQPLAEERLPRLR